MDVPGIATRMIQNHFAVALWIYSGLSRPFAQKTGDTSQCQVRGYRCAIGNDRHNVVDMKGRFLTFLREATVFATIVGTPDDQATQTCRNLAHGYNVDPREMRLARSRRSDSHSARSTS